MANNEIDSFIQKFKLLRGAGIEASLNFKTKLGEVWISLDCKVGRNVPPPLPTVATTVKRSPSYYRRQARRKAKREVVSGCTEVKSLLPLADEAEADILKDVGNIDDDVDEIEGSVVTDAESSEDDEVEDNNEEAEKVFVDEVNQDVCVKLETMIRESKKNRYLWDKLNSLPP